MADGVMTNREEESSGFMAVLLRRCFCIGAWGANYKQRTRKEGIYVSRKLGPAYGDSALPVTTASEPSPPVQQFQGVPRQAYIAHPLQPPSRNAPSPPHCLTSPTLIQTLRYDPPSYQPARRNRIIHKV